jgi:hypothetical protein
MLTGQRQLRDRPHRTVRAQHSVGQLEQRVRSLEQASVELLPQPGQLPGHTRAVGMVHTDQLKPLVSIFVCRKKKNRPRASLMINQVLTQQLRG